MATILKFRRFNTLNSAFIGSNGELTIDTDKKTIRLHDGQLTGGTLLATEQYVEAVMDVAIQNYDTSLVVDNKITTALGSYDTSSQVTTKIDAAIANIIDSAPSSLNTLNELAAALNDDSNYASTITTALGTKANTSDVTTSLALKADADDVTYELSVRDSTISALNAAKAPLASPALTGTPTAPTASSANRTTQIATTSYVQDNLDNYAELNSPALTGTPTAPTPATTVNDTQIATTAFVQTLIDQALKAAFPTGIITIWKGSVATIPTGYFLCDGTNGTPDLTDKFIVGAGDTYAPDDIGGSASKTLTNTELPAHTHTGTTDANGEHYHNIINEDSANSIALNPLTTTNVLAKIGSMSPTSSNYVLGGTDTTPTLGVTSTDPDHTHTFTTSSSGSGQAFDIRPPYYALCYIMKSWA